MNSKGQKLKLAVIGSSILTILLPGISFAAAGIKDTDYPIPTSNAYFVSPDGKDTNTGTETSPWSVAKALKNAPVGATIVFRGGTYRNINLNISKKLTLQAYPHEDAWIKGSIEVQDWVPEGNIWRKDGWNYSFPPNMGSEYIDPAYRMAGYRDMVYIDGASLKQVGSKAEVVPGRFYLDDASNQLYIGDDPTGKTVEATAWKEAFTMWKGTVANPTGTVIRGLGFAHYADRGINVGAPNITIENNTFVWNGQQGARITSATDAIVRGNIFSYNGRNGLWGGRANRSLIENNIITNNNVERFSKKWDAAGVKFTRTDGLVWRNNLVENNASIGLWMDVSSTNATIVNNTIRNNESNGILMEISHKAIIAGNVVSYNSPGGIAVVNSSGARIYNNTLAYNQTNIMIGDSPRNNTDPDEIAQGITWIVRDTVIKNNLLSNTSKGALLHNNGCKNREASALLISETNNNAYYRTSSKNPSSVINWSLGGSQCSVTYPTLAAFKTATGMEGNSLAIDNVATNPFFVDEANNDFRLKTGSPAIGRGSSLPSDIASALGLPAGVTVDLGALQATQY